MSTRILSWSQMVREADPDFSKQSLRPWVYEFSNMRRFYERQPVYNVTGAGGITDDFGNLITDDFGNPIVADQGGTGMQGFPFGEGQFGRDPF